MKLFARKLRILFKRRRRGAIRRFRSKVDRTRQVTQRARALTWHWFYHAKYRLYSWWFRHRTTATWAILFVLLGITAYLAPILQEPLEAHFATNERLDGLRSLYLTLGGALIGATAIAFSLVMFAMQVNVERMPHGLFHKLSSDRKLVGGFAAAFLLATALAVLSLIPDRSWVAASALGALWGTITILWLFLLSYRRALALINPLRQLGFVFADAKRELRAWGRRAERAAPLLQIPDSTEFERFSEFRSTFDTKRMMYFSQNPYWINGAQQAVLHAISFTRRYAEQGDHEVSGAALSVVAALNTIYVDVKGKTFFANHPFVENRFVTDGFINNTLEHLRQNIRIGVSRGDEQQIEQTLRVLATLVEVFLKIDYSQEDASKTHAQLAAAYLSDGVRDVVSHNMADLLMEGVRLMGQSAELFLAYSNPNETVTLIEKIESLACAGAVKADYRPVTLTAVEQLAKITFDLIRSNKYQIDFAVRQVTRSVSGIAKLFLTLPNEPMSNLHSATLGPYYSLTSTATLPSWLTDLGNALAKADAEDKAAQRIVRNIEEWADGLFQSKKELFLSAIEHRSGFAFDIIHWIAHITKILVEVSMAPPCDDRTRDELQKHALFLISVLSWVPDEKESVSFVENYQMTETLFEAWMDAHHRDCEKVSEAVRGILLSWAFKAGKHRTGWAILEDSLCGLAVGHQLTNDNGQSNRFKDEIKKRLENGNLLDQETRDNTAGRIRRTAENLYPKGHSMSAIERAMDQADHEKLRPLLQEIANLLSPDTA